MRPDPPEQAPDEQPEPTEAQSAQPEPAPELQLTPAHERIEVDLTALAPEPPRERGGANVRLWVVTRPALALALVAIVFGGPYLLLSFQRGVERGRSTNALDVWQESLSAVGLPLPGLPPTSAAPPDLLRARLANEAAYLERLELAERARLLQAWADMLQGRLDVEIPQGGEWAGLAAALDACRLLRRAEAGNPEPGWRELLAERVDAAPQHAARALKLCTERVNGKRRGIAPLARALAQEAGGGPVGNALLALADVAAGERTTQLLGQPPLGGLELDELLDLAQEQPEAVVAALQSDSSVSAGGPRPQLLEASADVAVASRLLALFELVGISETAAAWRSARAEIAAITTQRLGDYTRPAGEARQLGSRLGRLDASFELDGSTTFLGWRQHLAEIANDGPACVELAQRLAAGGYLPPALTLVLEPPAVGAGDELDPPSRSLVEAAAHAEALLRLSPADTTAGGGDEQLAELRQRYADVRQATLTRLANREDRAAARSRAQLSYYDGRLALARREAAVAREAFEQALGQGLPRLRGELWRARAAVRQPELPEATREDVLQALQELDRAVFELGPLPAAYTDLPPQRAVELELAAWPTDRASWNRRRAALGAVRGDLLAASGDVAGARGLLVTLQNALGDDPWIAWLEARLAWRNGDRAAALAAAERGATANGAGRTVRAECQALIRTIRGGN